MTLFKNVDLKDLENILNEGILPASVVGDNWGENKRASNSSDVVYLFNPISDLNTFTQYGLVLLEVDVEATQNTFEDNDVNKELYEEYICNEVKPNEIKEIYIPTIFQEIAKNELSEETFNKITFVEMTAKVIDSENSTPAIWEGFTMIQEYKPAYREVDEDLFKQWINTIQGFNASDLNYLRGIYENNEMIYLYEIKYKGV